MKKQLLLASLATLALASCSENEFLGTEEAQHVQNGDVQIAFSSGTAWMTRALKEGADAAALLNNNFVVEGIKGDGSTQTEVFDHYNVNYAASTANTTESNTANWEYVGIGKHGLSASSKQTIKYWDFSAKQYDFVGFSYGKSNYEKAVLTEIKYANLGKAVDADGNSNAVYTVTGAADELAKTYVADLVTKYNRNGVSEFGTDATNNTVTLKFRSLGTKVRVAFYETVPGYSVKNVKFYDEAWDGTTTSDAGADDATLFAASAIFPSASSKGTMSVYFPTVGWANSANGTLSPDYNQAHIKFEAGSESTDALVTTKIFGELANMAAAEDAEEEGDIYLGRTSSEATYAGDVTAADRAYQIVLPLGTKDNLQLRIEYDLVPTDGAEEVIHVRDARAVVPAAYADWKPNYAYTYIFKISDNTNGWTGVTPNPEYDPENPGDTPEYIPVEGLTPITFDAVVVETEDGIQETITTVATPSITTYQEGKVVTSKDEYEAGDVYVSVMNGTTPVTLTDSPANYGVYLVTDGADKVTEAIAQDMLSGVKTNTGITWTPAIYEAVSTVPAADGNTLSVSAAKFAAAAGNTYVFDVIVGGKNYVKIIKVAAAPAPVAPAPKR